MMDPILENKVLILKTDLILHPDYLRDIRHEIIQQIKEGVVVIPSEFTCEIIDRASLVMTEEKQ